ncbi:MAG: glycosyltransferase family 4 protein [Candidatus Thermoplasmatota archaeon]
MKILIAMKNFFPPLGGAELSLLALANKLGENNEVHSLFRKTALTPEKFQHVFTIKDFPRPLGKEFHWLDMNYQAKQWKKIALAMIGKINPDLIITQLEYMPPTVFAAKMHGIKTIVFVRSYEHFCPNAFYDGVEKCKKLEIGSCWQCLSLMDRIQYYSLKKCMDAHKYGIKNADLVIANSKFVAEIIKKFFEVHAEVVHPFIDLERCRSVEQSGDKEKKYILAMKLSKRKGLITFIKIAEIMKNREFLILGGADYGSDISLGKKLQNTKNIKIIDWSDNPKKIFQKTRLLLFPSMWPEPFGRGVIEAGINGIPTIASNVGGLSESVGKGGILIDDFGNPLAWVESIKKLDDDLYYSELSKAAEENAKEFDFSKKFGEFRSIVAKSLNLNI